jgi:bis(5'-nucleosyl)-tetraphosphatase (symmetrical)
VARDIFIGDVQGCREELEELLEALRYDPASDALHPVGDLVNRGPDSPGVLRLLCGLDAGGVLGNHDVHALRVAAGRERARAGDTLDALLACGDREPLLAWLARRPFARRIGGVLLVHAGLHPAWRDPVAVLAGLDPLARHPDSEFATHVRHCTQTGERPPSDDPPPGGPFRPWYEFRAADAATRETVVFGHWAAQGLLRRPGLRGLDTACVWGGRLSAWIAGEDRLVSVPARRVWQRP